jgi:hypothetical protein
MPSCTFNTIARASTLPNLNFKPAPKLYSPHSVTKSKLTNEMVKTICLCVGISVDQSRNRCYYSGNWSRFQIKYYGDGIKMEHMAWRLAHLFVNEKIAGLIPANSPLFNQSQKFKFKLIYFNHISQVVSIGTLLNYFVVNMEVTVSISLDPPFIPLLT